MDRDVKTFLALLGSMALIGITVATLIEVGAARAQARMLACRERVAALGYSFDQATQTCGAPR